MGGAGGYGTVFEIAHSGGVYASTPTTLVSFDLTNGYGPLAGLIADANGNLFGTTNAGGASGNGTVFEITGSGFAPPRQFAGTPGSVDCAGKSTSTLAKTYGGVAHAAASLGFKSAADLHTTVAAYCAQ